MVNFNYSWICDNKNMLNSVCQSGVKDLEHFIWVCPTWLHMKKIIFGRRRSPQHIWKQVGEIFLRNKVLFFILLCCKEWRSDKTPKSQVSIILNSSIFLFIKHYLFQIMQIYLNQINTSEFYFTPSFKTRLAFFKSATCPLRSRVFRLTEASFLKPNSARTSPRNDTVKLSRRQLIVASHPIEWPPWIWCCTWWNHSWHSHLKSS